MAVSGDWNPVGPDASPDCPASTERKWAAAWKLPGLVRAGGWGDTQHIRAIVRSRVCMLTRKRPGDSHMTFFHIW